MADKKKVLTQVDDIVVPLMEEAYNLKQALDDKIGDDVYDPEVHIARRYKECKLNLASVQMSLSAEGLKGGGFEFVARTQEGRESLNKELVVQNLLAVGLEIDVINGVISKSMKKGDPFWVQEIRRAK